MVFVLFLLIIINIIFAFKGARHSPGHQAKELSWIKSVFFFFFSPFVGWFVHSFIHSFVKNRYCSIALYYHFLLQHYRIFFTILFFSLYKTFKIFSIINSVLYKLFQNHLFTMGCLRLVLSSIHSLYNIVNFRIWKKCEWILGTVVVSFLRLGPWLTAIICWYWTWYD